MSSRRGRSRRSRANLIVLDEYPLEEALIEEAPNAFSALVDPPT
jgi:hypothetical protein